MCAMFAPRFIVICLASEEEGYWLTTRTAFRTRESAERYASAIAESRKAIVVECPRGVDFREEGV